MSNTEVIPKKILTDILSHRCNVISDSQMGKTNLVKVLVAEYEKLDIPVQRKVFDTAQVWRHSYLNSFKFQEINDETQRVLDAEDSIIYDIEYFEAQQISSFMGNIVLLDYQRNRERKKFTNGKKLNDWILYILEESQNSLGSMALNRSDGSVWLKAISEGANFNLSFLFIGQRAQDISTKALERSQTYFIGRTTGDNNTRKLKGLIGSKAGIESLDGKGEPLHVRAQKLSVGEFIFWNGKEAWTFQCPLFDDLYPNQQPQQVTPPKQRWSRIF